MIIIIVIIVIVIIVVEWVDYQVTKKSDYNDILMITRTRTKKDMWRMN